MKKIVLALCFFSAYCTVYAFSKNDIVVPWTVGLRIRTNPSAASNIAGVLGLWEKITVVDQRPETETIGGNEGNWLQIKRQNNQTGWCFSYFLEKIDVDNFFPILEYRGRAYYTGGGTLEVYTCYNDGQKREKLVLGWEGKTISIFENLRISADGTVIAFTWLDTATIRRGASRGTISGKRILFVYDFSSHQLSKIDESNIEESDTNSDRWRGRKWDIGPDETDEDFFIDHNLMDFCLNFDGSKLFYIKNNRSAIEANMYTGTRITHSVTVPKFCDPRYMGNYVYFIINIHDDNWILYDPVKRDTLSEEFHNNQRQGGAGYWLEGVLKGRYLFIARTDGGFEGVVVFDLTTGRKTNYPNDDLPYGHAYYSPDHRYLISHSLQRPQNPLLPYQIDVRKIDYRNNIVTKYSYNNLETVPDTFEVFKDGIAGFNQASVMILLFDNRVLQYGFEDPLYKPSLFGYEVHLMNKYK
jgi:hypothetical protein